MGFYIKWKDLTKKYLISLTQVFSKLYKNFLKVKINWRIGNQAMYFDYTTYKYPIYIYMPHNILI